MPGDGDPGIDEMQVETLAGMRHHAFEPGSGVNGYQLSQRAVLAKKAPLGVRSAMAPGSVLLPAADDVPLEPGEAAFQAKRERLVE
jgi:hypothetical protein